ncbi:MAG: CDP-alcohol phosphatidyltransferase family protein [Caldimicrobium sp.]
MKINKKDILNLPNFLSLYRFILGLIFPFLWIKKISIKVLLFLIGTAVLSDTLDGNLARILKQKTDLGKILDPLADKVFINMLFVILYLNQNISLFFLLIIFLRDLSILIGGGILLLKSYQTIDLNPTFLGKACTVFQLVFLFLYFFHLFIKPLNSFLIFGFTQIVIFLTILSGIQYGFIFYTNFTKSPIR